MIAPITKSLRFQRQYRLFAIIIWLLLGIVISSCTSQSQNQILPTRVNIPAPTQAPVQPVSSLVTQEPVEPDAFVTQEVETENAVNEGTSLSEINSASAAETPEVFIPNPNVRYKTEDGELFVVVTGLHDKNTMPALPDAAEGEQFVVLSATLANLTDEPIDVAPNSLTLIDQQFNSYPAITPDDFFRTILTDIELNGQSTVKGVIRFSIPSDAIPYLLEWCPYNDCEIETLQTRLP